jgi:hypothetical protein
MNQRDKTGRMGRVVMVPQPLASINELPPNRPLSVVLAEDEGVEWIWSTLPGGQQYVSGYKIVKKGSGHEKQ